MTEKKENSSLTYDKAYSPQSLSTYKKKPVELKDVGQQVLIGIIRHTDWLLNEQNKRNLDTREANFLLEAAGKINTIINTQERLKLDNVNQETREELLEKIDKMPLDIASKNALKKAFVPGITIEMEKEE